MPVIGRSDNDGIKRLVVDQLAPVGVTLWGVVAAVFGFLFGQIQIGGFEIANGGRSGVTIFEEAIVHLISTIAQANVANHGAVIRSQDLRVAQRGHGRGLRKLPSIQESASCKWFETVRVYPVFR